MFGQQRQLVLAVCESLCAEGLAFAMIVGIVNKRVVYLVGGAVGLKLYRLSAAAVHHPYTNAAVVGQRHEGIQTGVHIHKRVAVA